MKAIREASVLNSRVMELMGRTSAKEPLTSADVAEKPFIAEKTTNKDQVAVLLSGLHKAKKINRVQYKDPNRPNIRYAYYGLNGDKQTPATPVTKRTAPAQPVQSSQPHIRLRCLKDGSVSLVLGKITINISVEE